MAVVAGDFLLAAGLCAAQGDDRVGTVDDPAHAGLLQPLAVPGTALWMMAPPVTLRPQHTGQNSATMAGPIGPPGRSTQRAGHWPTMTIDTASMAKLRAAQVEDVRAIVAIDPCGPSRSAEIEDLVQKQASLVAVQDGAIVGFLGVKPTHFYQRDFIDLLLVSPNSRRQGLGRALMRTALQNASTQRVFTSTNESNTPMRELLRTEGWHPSGILTGLDEGDPEHIFFHDTPPA